MGEHKITLGEMRSSGPRRVRAQSDRGRDRAEGEREMNTPEPIEHKDIRLRTLLSSWKQGRGFRSVAANHYRNRLVHHTSKTDLNRVFGKRRSSAQWGWFFIALFLLAAIDYFCLRIGVGLK